MHLKSLLGSLGAAALLLTACPAPKADQPKAAEPAKPAAKAEGERGAGKMRHCPSAVDGAVTTLTDAPDGVVVSVTAAADPAVVEVRSRAMHLAAISAKNPTGVKHDGEGEGGGGLGNCPVVLADTAITARDLPNGTELTVKPVKSTELARLKELSHERLTRMQQARTATAAPAAGAGGQAQPAAQ